MAPPVENGSAVKASQVDEQPLTAEVAAPPPKPPARGGGLRGILAGIVLGVILALVGGRVLGGRSEAPEPPTSTAEVAAQTVAVATATPAPVQQTLAVSGTIAAVDLLEVTPQVSGLQIQQVQVDEGDTVAAGQVLATLNTDTLMAQVRQSEANVASAQAQIQQRQAAVAQAQARLAEAQQDVQRYRTLAQQGAISEQEATRVQTEATTAREAVTLAQADVASAEAGLRSQQAELDRLRTQLNQAVVRAPAAGIIAESFATAGSVSSTSTPLFTLIQNNQLELQAEVAQAQLSRVAVGAPVTITSASDPQLQLQGSVREIQPLVDADTRTAYVNIALPSTPQLRPGMFLQGEIVTGRRQGLTIPASAVVSSSDDEAIVYTIDATGQAATRPVEVGERLPETVDQPARVEVLSGLQVGDSVVTAGAGYLQDGDRVTIVDSLP